MLRRWALGALAAGLLVSTVGAKQGIVRTRDNAAFTGDITEDEKSVTVNIHGVTTKIDKRNVLKIEYIASLDDQYKEKVAKLAPDDVKGRIELAKWANSQSRPDLAISALTEARKIDPSNRDAAVMLDDVQRQKELDDQAKQGGQPAHPPVAAQATHPAAGAATSKPVAEHRLLTADEINVIRQREMTADDPHIQIRFDNKVVQRYLASDFHGDAAEFRKRSAIEQALDILANGDSKLANDVRVTTDPAPIVEFRTKVLPIYTGSGGCALSGCHGSTKNSNFHLFTGSDLSNVYTNYYILQKYSATINGVQYSMVDRNTPDQSLMLLYALPGNLSKVPHPNVPGYRPRFRTLDDAAYQTVLNWVTKTLKPIGPDYGLNVSPEVPSTQPAKK